MIEKQLVNWFDEMLQKYTWLNIKYEYNDIEKSFLVSFSPSILTKAAEDFSKDALEFENKMNEEYDIEAPLFCDDEELFELSPNATSLSTPYINTFTNEFSEYLIPFNLNLSNTLCGMEFEGDTFCFDNNEYNIAA